MQLTLEEALRIAREKEGYERCFREDHGLGQSITYDGKTALCEFLICPIIQFYLKPSYQFHSVEDFLKSSEKAYRQRGWWDNKPHPYEHHRADDDGMAQQLVEGSNA